MSKSTQPFHKLIFKSRSQWQSITLDHVIENASAHQIRVWLDQVKLALMRERNKGKLQHFRYDMNRHIALAATRKALAMQLKAREQK